MKWAKLTKEVDTRYPKDKNKIRECGGNSNSHQVGFDDLQMQLRLNGEPPLGEWISHDLSPSEYNLDERERYEHFVCGYLFHYDFVKQKDHTIYFRWEPDGHPQKKYKVTIYLSPEATTGPGLAKDPPTPPPPPPPPMS